MIALIVKTTRVIITTAMGGTIEFLAFAGKGCQTEDLGTSRVVAALLHIVTVRLARPRSNLALTEIARAGQITTPRIPKYNIDSNHIQRNPI